MCTVVIWYAIMRVTHMGILLGYPQNGKKNVNVQ